MPQFELATDKQSDDLFDIPLGLLQTTGNKSIKQPKLNFYPQENLIIDKLDMSRKNHENFLMIMRTSDRRKAEKLSLTSNASISPSSLLSSSLVTRRCKINYCRVNSWRSVYLAQSDSVCRCSLEHYFIPSLQGSAL
jgi:hypothetical protein